MARILVIEDDRTSARLLGLLLKKGGHSQVTAHNFAAAERAIHDDGDFDMVILDNQLENRYGWEFLEVLRSHFYFKQLPVVVYTAAGDRESVSMYVKLGVQNIRTKPYSWDVLCEEIEKVSASGWRSRDIEPRAMVQSRLGISEAEYFEGLRDIEQQLLKACDNLLGLLSPSKRGQFLSVFSGLRSITANYGLQVIARITAEAVSAYQEEDWSRTVKGVQMLKLVAGWLASERAEFEAAAPGSEAEELTVFSLDAVTAPSLLPIQGAISSELSEEVPSGFRDLALNLAQVEIVSRLVDGSVEGRIPVSDWQKKLEVIGNSIQWHARLEPNDIEAVSSVITDEQPDLKDLLNAMCDADALSGGGAGRSIRDAVSELGVYPSALLFLTAKWLRILQDEGFPLKMESLAIRQLTAAGIIRRLASKISRPINFESIVCIEFLGEWAFALKYPGVYAFCLLESTNNAVRKHASAFAKIRNPILEKLNVPDFCRATVSKMDQDAGENVGSARLAVGLMTLADIIIAGHHDRESGHGLEAARQRFAATEAWGLLAGQSLKLPDDRSRFFDTLIDWVPVFESRAEAIRISKPALVS